MQHSYATELSPFFIYGLGKPRVFQISNKPYYLAWRLLCQASARLT